MASGVKVSPDVKSIYDDFKLNKTDYKYLVLGLSDDLKEVIILKKATKADGDYSSFKCDLKDAEDRKDCRYVIYDYAYTTKNESHTSKPVFFYWAPDCAKIKQKMVYSATRQALVAALGGGLAITKECHDFDDLDENEIDKELCKH